jgi:hypothetical protein
VVGQYGKKDAGLIDLMKADIADSLGTNVLPEVH